MTTITLKSLAGAAVSAGFAALLLSAPASALTMKECSAKYQSAKEAGTLGGLKWNDFRKTQCGDSAASPANSAATPSASKTKAAAPTPEAKSLTM